MMKKNRVAILSILLTTVLLTYQVTLAKAEEMKSDNWLIQFGNFNVTSGKKNSSSYSVTDTVGQTASGPYGSYGSSSYFVGSGFQYIYQIDTFSFAISKTLIDFGELTPDIHNTDSHNLTITTKGAGGYTVYAFEEHALKNIDSSDKIKDTSCDADNCTHEVAGVWTDQTIHGFGYNMSGNDIPAHFIDSSYYKHFANRANNEEMQVVMSSDDVADQRSATVNYKAGIGGDQAGGSYETAVVFIAVPGF